MIKATEPVEAWRRLPKENSGERWRQVTDFHTANSKSLHFSPSSSPLCLSSREPSRPTSLLPADWSSGLGLGKEDEPLPPGLETLPLRLMQQDCTAVKTLLLRLRRTLQEVGYAYTQSVTHAQMRAPSVGACSEWDINWGDEDYIPGHYSVKWPLMHLAVTKHKNDRSRSCSSSLFLLNHTDRTSCDPVLHASNCFKPVRVKGWLKNMRQKAFRGETVQRSTDKFLNLFHLREIISEVRRFEKVCVISLFC